MWCCKHCNSILTAAASPFREDLLDFAQRGCINWAISALLHHMPTVLKLIIYSGVVSVAAIAAMAATLFWPKKKKEKINRC